MSSSRVRRLFIIEGSTDHWVYKYIWKVNFKATAGQWVLKSIGFFNKTSTRHTLLETGNYIMVPIELNSTSQSTYINPIDFNNLA